MDYVDRYADGCVRVSIEATGSPGFEIIGVINGVIGGRGIVRADGSVTFDALGRNIGVNHLQVRYAVLHEDEFEEPTSVDHAETDPQAH